MLFRKAVIKDLPAIADIMHDAVTRMLREGKCQWNENYPTQMHILDDIKNDVGYVLEDGGSVIAYGAVVFDGEPAYEYLDGAWLSDGDYVVVHRVAVMQSCQSAGVGSRFMRCVEQLAASSGIGSFRIDTNFDNERMLGLIERCGFEFCGTVQYATGERRAFEKLI